MQNTPVNPAIEIKKVKGVDCIYFTFNGKLTETDATHAVVAWKSHLEKSNKSFPHIWDCKLMTGYEPMARILWQQAIKELKSNISKIWLITTSPLIIAGAKILTLFTSFDIATVRSEEEIAMGDLAR
jgi:hypothetical protein